MDMEEVLHAGVGPLYFIKSRISAPLCQEMWGHFILASADKLNGDVLLKIQQDLTLAHTDKSTITWFNDHSAKVLDWLENLLDLIPI